MRYEPTCLSTTCGVRTVHPQRILAQWMATICPGRISAVANTHLQPAPRSHGADPGEVRRVVHAVSVQLMRWGADLCFQHAARLLAQSIPGLQLPMGLFNAVRCLGAVARRDLLQSLEAALCAALAQPGASRYLQALMGEPATARLQAAAARSDLVIGLALCALLLQRLQADQPTLPQTWLGRMLAGSVSALRVVSNAGRVTTPHDELRPPSALASVPSFDYRLVSAIFPRAGALLQPAEDPADDPVAASWGVHAKARKRPRQRPAKAIGGAVTGQRDTSKAGPYKRRPLAPGAGVHARHTHADQRDTFSAPDGAGPGYSGPSKLKKRKKARERPEEQDVPASRRKPGPTPRTKPHPQVGEANATTAAAAGTRAPGRGATGMACLRFDNLQRTRHQIQQLPLLGPARDVLFCVHRNATRAFEDLFATASTGDDDVVAMRAIPEADCRPGGADEGLRMYSGLGQLRRAAPRGLTSLGDYRLFRVATLSLISDPVRQAHPEADERLLPSNHFAVIRTPQCDDSERLHLAFFVRRAAPQQAAMNFGFSEIERHDGHLVVREDGLLLESNSRGLGHLIPRIEDVSGLRQAGRGTTSAVAARHRAVPVHDANHMFIRREALPSVPVDRSVRLLQAQEVGAINVLQGSERTTSRAVIYRMSFRASPDALFYVDRAGRQGVLYLGPGAGNARGLTALPGTETEFLQQHGLDGRTIEEAVEILENYGFSRLPEPGDTASDTPFPLNGFRIRSDDAASAQPSWDGRSGTFAIHAQDPQVQYVDEEGDQGVMEFATVRHHPHGCVVLEGNELSALLFARRVGLVEYREYTWHDIRKALHAHGLVER